MSARQVRPGHRLDEGGELYVERGRAGCPHVEARPRCAPALEAADLGLRDPRPRTEFALREPGSEAPLAQGGAEPPCEQGRTLDGRG